jgi:ADP-ribose pyrophosphatase YjhB (NUDIX family)
MSQFTKSSKKNSINFNNNMENFEICIRAVVQNKGKILVCFHKEKGYYFLPGGHLEFGKAFLMRFLEKLRRNWELKLENFL